MVDLISKYNNKLGLDEVILRNELESIGSSFYGEICNKETFDAIKLKISNSSVVRDYIEERLFNSNYKVKIEAKIDQPYNTIGFSIEEEPIYD